MRTRVVFLPLLFFVLQAPVISQTAEQKLHPRYPELLNHNRAFQSAYKRGDYKTALGEAQTAVKIAREIFGPEAQPTATTYNDLGIVYEAIGKYDRAIELYQAALRIRLKKPGTPHPQIAITYGSLGGAYKSKGEYGRAIEYYRKALEIADKTPGFNRTTIAITYGNLGAVYQLRGEYEQAIDYNRKALSILTKNPNRDPSHVATTYNNLGEAYRSTGEYNRALEYFRKSLKIVIKMWSSSHPSAAITFNNLGLTYELMGRYNRAVTYFRRALVIFINKLDSEHPYVAITLNNSGQVYNSKGEYKRAIEYYQQALVIFKKKLNADHLNIAVVYNNLGSVYEAEGDYERAIEYYRKNLAILNKRPKPGHPYVATTYNNLGSVYEAKGEYDRSIEYYQKSLRIKLKNFGPGRLRLANTYNNLGGAYESKGEYGQAIEYYQKSQAILLKKLGSEHPRVMAAYGNLASVYENKGEYDRALKYYQEAEKRMNRGENRHFNITINANIAVMHEQAGRKNQAIKKFKHVINLILRYRRELGRHKSNFMSRYIPVFDRFIALEIQRGPEYHSAAFRVDIQKRGLSIAEDLSREVALERGGLPESKRAQIVKLSDEIQSLSWRRQSLEKRKKYKLAKKLLDQLLLLEGRRQELDHKLLNDYPRYANLLRPHPPTIKQLQDGLQSDEIMLSYTLALSQPGVFAVTKKAGLRYIALKTNIKKITRTIRNLRELYTGTPDRDRSAFKTIKGKTGVIYWNSRVFKNKYKIKGQEVFARVKIKQDRFLQPLTEKGFRYRYEKIGSFTGYLSAEDLEDIRDDLKKELYDLLLSPILKQEEYKNAKRLIVIPDGPAYYLPFHLLLRDKGLKVKLAHSPIVWRQLRASKKTPAKLAALIVGNAIYPSGRGLPGANAELNTIAARIYKNPAERSRHVLTGERAGTWEIFRLNKNRRLQNYRILHFGVHGVLDDEKPDLNSLYLSDPHELERSQPATARRLRDKYGELGDGHLRLGAIKTLRLNADLVVLSACDTSIGHEMGGEGMVALPQAFLIAGARNVVASLWPVDDQATARFMNYFYTFLHGAKEAPAEALRLAREYMQKGIYTDPYYWAGFVIYGE